MASALPLREGRECYFNKSHPEKSSHMPKDLSDFLTPEPVLLRQGGPGFTIFGIDHLVLIVLSLAISFGIALWYRHLPAGDVGSPSRKRRALLLGASGTALAILLLKDVSYVLLGIFEPLFWPLHICNFCEYAAFVYALRPSSRWGSRAAQLLFCWGTVGLSAALFLPGWSPYCPAWSLASLCGFAEHALGFGCALCLLVGDDYRPRPRNAWFVLAASVVGGMSFRFLNPLLGTNFFFVTNPATVGPPGAMLIDLFGDPGFLWVYLLLAFCLWAMLYGIWRMRHWA